MTAPLTLIVGAGYTGRRVARRLADERAAVHCLTGSAASAAALADAGIAATALDLDESGTLPRLPGGALRVLYLVPPGEGEGEDDPRLARFLAALPRQPERFVLASTSGVYGDCGGELVDEERPPAPSTERARRRVAAETTLRRWADAEGVSWTILRIAGIYGPGRLPLEAIRSGQPVIREEDASPGNRIHVDDLARVCIAALEPAAPGGIYNVADGSGQSSGAFFRRVAEAAGLPAPPAVSRAEARRQMSPMRYSFLAEARRLDTRRLRETLGVELAYDDPAAGVRASLEEAGAARDG
ncbi:SDR family oxidoreductase [Lentisalinibacter orientalis]|uniref:SDR family oxidoreductase n=1 Tax=Lentisalinibacter orientalis TaxID=2992241 RepID=UPI00386C4495